MPHIRIGNPCPWAFQAGPPHNWIFVAEIQLASRPSSVQTGKLPRKSKQSLGPSSSCRGAPQKASKQTTALSIAPVPALLPGYLKTKRGAKCPIRDSFLTMIKRDFCGHKLNKASLTWIHLVIIFFCQWCTMHLSNILISAFGASVISFTRLPCHLRSHTRSMDFTVQCYEPF